MTDFSILSVTDFQQWAMDCNQVLLHMAVILAIATHRD